MDESSLRSTWTMVGRGWSTLQEEPLLWDSREGVSRRSSVMEQEGRSREQGEGRGEGGCSSGREQEEDSTDRGSSHTERGSSHTDRGSSQTDRGSSSVSPLLQGISASIALQHSNATLSDLL